MELEPSLWLIIIHTGETCFEARRGMGAEMCIRGRYASYEIGRVIFLYEAFTLVTNKLGNSNNTLF